MLPDGAAVDGSAEPVVATQRPRAIPVSGIPERRVFPASRKDIFHHFENGMNWQFLAAKNICIESEIIDRERKKYISVELEPSVNDRKCYTLCAGYTLCGPSIFMNLTGI
jgi:hypothetical protein